MPQSHCKKFKKTIYMQHICLLRSKVQNVQVSPRQVGIKMTQPKLHSTTAAKFKKTKFPAYPAPLLPSGKMLHGCSLQYAV